MKSSEKMAIVVGGARTALAVTTARALAIQLVAVSLGTMMVALWISALIRRRRQKVAAT